MAKERLPWFKCFPTKLLGALSVMEPDEGLVYTIILLRIYEVGGPAKDDSRTISRRCGLPRKRVQVALDSLSEEGKIVVENGLIDSETTHQHLEDFEIFQNNMKKAGKASAAKRKEKNQQNQQNGATDVQQSVNKTSTTKTKDIDIDNRHKKDTPNGVSKKPPKKRSSIGLDTKPTDAQTAYAKRVGMDRETFIREWHKFKNHHVSKGTLAMDWNATWRTWASKWAEWNGKNPAPDEDAVGDTLPEQERRIKFAGGYNWTESAVRKAVEEWEQNPRSWPESALGSPPGQPGCQVPDDLLPIRLRRSTGEGEA